MKNFKLFITENEAPHISHWLHTNDNAHISEKNNPNEISAHLKQHAPKLNPTETTAVKHYANNSHQINRGLLDDRYNKSIISRSVLKDNKSKIDALDSATTKEIGTHVSVYSGLDFNPKERMDKHSNLLMPAFTSTTHHKETALKYSDKSLGDQHVLHIKMKPDDWGAHISHHSESYNDHETILPRNTELKIHPKPKSYINDRGDKIHVWSAHINNVY